MPGGLVIKIQIIMNIQYCRIYMMQDKQGDPGGSKVSHKIKFFEWMTFTFILSGRSGCQAEQ